MPDREAQLLVVGAPKQRPLVANKTRKKTKPGSKNKAGGQPDPCSIVLRDGDGVDVFCILTTQALKDGEDNLEVGDVIQPLSFTASVRYPVDQYHELDHDGDPIAVYFVILNFLLIDTASWSTQPKVETRMLNMFVPSKTFVTGDVRVASRRGNVKVERLLGAPGQPPSASSSSASLGDKCGCGCNGPRICGGTCCGRVPCIVAQIPPPAWEEAIGDRVQKKYVEDTFFIESLSQADTTGVRNSKLKVMRFILYYWYATEVFLSFERMYLPDCVVHAVRSKYPCEGHALYATMYSESRDLLK
jgi:hypothetical protein